MSLTCQVVVPAHQAAKEIEACIGGILAAGFRKDEILVVDDGSYDDTSSILKRLGIATLRNDVARGPAEARNRGVSEATADLIVFVDADVVIKSGARERIDRWFDTEHGLDALFGSYDNSPPAPAVVSRYRNLLHHFVHQNSRADAGTFWTGFGIVRRATFERLGGLDRAWQNIEDVEFGMRLKRAGGRIVLDRQLLCTHLKAWTMRSMVRTDILGRAIPWTRLLLKGYPGDDLNITAAHQQSAVFVAVFLAAALASAVHALFLIVAAAALAGFVWVNLDFVRLLRRRHGLAFAVACLPLHALHYLSAIVGYGWVRTLDVYRRIFGRDSALEEKLR